VIRATVDTNVLAHGLARAGEVARPSAEVIRQWLSAGFELVVSEHVLEELGITLRKPYFLARLTSEQAEEWLGLIRLQAEVVPLSGSVAGVAAHPHDDPVLETALAGRAANLVTGDRALLALGSYEGSAF
jgi:uncharacterized protein